MEWLIIVLFRSDIIVNYKYKQQKNVDWGGNNQVANKEFI